MSNFTLSPKTYSNFVDRVLTEERHFWSEATKKKFLDALLESSKSRVAIIPQGTEYFRARTCNATVGILPKEEMKPKKNLKSEGRVNPYNISVLYLTSRRETAIAETRSERRHPITVARFITTRELKLIDCTVDRPDWYWYYNGHNPNSEKEAENFTWVEIGGAFSKPADNENQRQFYIPTQIIADFFKFNGFDGIIYQSQYDARQREQEQFSEISQNIALFNIDDAEAVDAQLWHIENKIIVASPINGNTTNY